MGKYIGMQLSHLCDPNANAHIGLSVDSFFSLWPKHGFIWLSETKCLKKFDLIELF